MRCLALGIVAVGWSLAACGGEDEARNGIEVAPATGCQGAACDESSPEGEPTKAARGPSADAPETDPGTPPAPPVQAPAPSTENTCTTAVDLGSMAGEAKLFESNVESFATQGACTTWVKIRVAETRSVPDGLGVKATLVSPSTKKFDLSAFVDKDKDELACQTPTETSASTTSTVDDVSVVWGDSLLSDDSRTVTFQVKSRDGKCDPTNKWSLVVKSRTAF